MAEQTEKEKKLKEVIEKLNKDHGKGTVMTMTDVPMDLEVISTGSIALNKALGVGGLPRGRVVEIYGPESAGKTTLAIHVMAECQKMGGVCAIVDAEHAFDKKYAEALGVDTDKLLISQPDYGEQGLEVVDKLASSGSVDLIVVDSVAALIPKAELDGEMGASKMGLHARLMSQALRKLTATVFNNNVILIFINQLRDKIGVMFGSPETTTGGNALKFYASVRLDIRRIAQIKDGEVVIGNRAKVKVIKNKVAPPFQVAEFNIEYGMGIEKNAEIVEMAIELEIIKKGGAWLSYEDTKVQGVDKFKSLLADNPDFAEELTNKINEKLADV